MTESHPSSIKLTSAQQLIRDGQTRFGTARFVILMTIGVMVISGGITAVILAIAGYLVPVERHTFVGMGTSLVIPAIVVPVLTVIVANLIGRLGDAYDELYVVSTTDALTGVPNRRGFFLRAEELLGDAGDEHVLVAMVDIDAFKLVNDHNGHESGDRTLRRLATRLEAAAASIAETADDDAGAPQRSLVGRIGGDEFAVLVIGLPDTGCGPAVAALRSACERVDVCATASASATVGTALRSATEGLDALLRAADRDLYRHKERATRADVTRRITRD